jgi:phosphoglycolate phosphatase
MKNNIVFDFDGTLYDSYEGIILAFNKSSIQLFNKENFLNKNEIGPKLKDLYARAFDNLYLESYSKFEVLFRQNYDQEFYKLGKLYEGVEELLAFFHEQGYRMFIVSNKPQKILNKTVEEFQITQYFKSIIGSNSSLINDGDKIEKLKSIIDTYNIDAYNCYIIGDTVEDLNMARFNNCNFIHAKYGYGQINEPCKSVDSVKELKKYIV